MSIMSNMESYTLQKRIKNRTESGYEKTFWEDVGPIEVSVFETDETLVHGSEKYRLASHVGFTYHEGLQSGVYRLQKDGIIYEITSCNAKIVPVNLLLKVVSSDV